VRAVRQCCGLPLLQAGDRQGMLRAAKKLADEVADAEMVVAADPGCARALTLDAVASGTALPPIAPLIDLVYARLDRFPTKMADETPRYHDPCQLGRGLGRYEEPRAVIAKVTGRVPAELQRNRESAECSGGGGLLPVTRPASSRAMADAALAEHERLGGGPLVAACGESLRRFRSRDGDDVVGLWSLIAGALEDDDVDRG